MLFLFLFFSSILLAPQLRREQLRRNPIENRTISGQKFRTKIYYHNNFNLSILESFLHFLKAKHIISWNNTENNFPWKREKINFKTQRTCANTGRISSSVLFHQYFQVFYTKFNIRFVCMYVCMYVCILNWPLPIGAFQDQCKQTMINKYSK